jgi:hypothetical protein
MRRRANSSQEPGARKQRAVTGKQWSKDVKDQKKRSYKRNGHQASPFEKKQRNAIIGEAARIKDDRFIKEVDRKGKSRLRIVP